jgi:hypothetical protein
VYKAAAAIYTMEGAMKVNLSFTATLALVRDIAWHRVNTFNHLFLRSIFCLSHQFVQHKHVLEWLVG